jgi:hypothetical protein
VPNVTATRCVTNERVVVNDEWKQCPPLRDETDNCDVFYAYHYASDDVVHVQKTKRKHATLCFFISLQ